MLISNTERYVVEAFSWFPFSEKALTAIFVLALKHLLINIYTNVAKKLI